MHVWIYVLLTELELGRAEVFIGSFYAQTKLIKNISRI